MEMSVSALEDGIQEVVFDGSLDAAGVQRVELPFSALAGKHADLLIDLSKVGFLASLGLRMLVINAKLVQRRGGKMVLVGPQPTALKVLHSTGIDQMIPVYSDRESALAAFRDAGTT